MPVGTMEQLVGSATGGVGARGVKGSKKNASKSRLRKFETVQFGVG